eukprot:78995-Chlamydomonas_euryale.AAC.1
MTWKRWCACACMAQYIWGDEHALHMPMPVCKQHALHMPMPVCKQHALHIRMRSHGIARTG